MRPTFIAAATATGALVVAGTVSGIVAQSTANRLNTAFGNNTLTLSDAGSYGTVHTAATIANVSFCLAAATAITGAVLVIVNPSVVHAAGSGGDSPSIGIGPAGIVVGGRF